MEKALSAQIQIVAVGKIKEKFFADAIAEYVKRLSRFCKLRIIEVEDEKNPEEQTEARIAQVLRRERDRIKPHLKNIKNANVVALDINGSRMSSEKFADLIKRHFESDGTLSFVIGGSLGLDREILETSNLRLSLSDMTFPHQMARIMLTEQIYRSFKIIGNEKYHK